MDIVPWLEWSWKQQRLDRNTNIKFMFYWLEFRLQQGLWRTKGVINWGTLRSS